MEYHDGYLGQMCNITVNILGRGRWIFISVGLTSVFVFNCSDIFFYILDGKKWFSQSKTAQTCCKFSILPVASLSCIISVLKIRLVATRHLQHVETSLSQAHANASGRWLLDQVCCKTSILGFH